MPDSIKCYIRILHAIPNITGVDLYINEHLAVKDLKYRDFTQYYGGRPGIYNIRAYSRTASGVPIFDRTIDLHENVIYTLALTGIPDDIGANLIVDTKKAVDKSKAYIRYINLCPSITDFDIMMNNSLVVDDLIYNEVSDYIAINPGTYSMKAVDSVTSTVKLEDPRMTLYAGKEYAGYIVGLDEGSPELQILIPLEGATYLT